MDNMFYCHAGHPGEQGHNKGVQNRVIGGPKKATNVLNNFIKNYTNHPSLSQNQTLPPRSVFPVWLQSCHKDGLLQ